MDPTLRGARCRTTRPIAHHAGWLPRELRGTVRYTTENLGRTLVCVEFDSGQSLLVLADDVSIEGVTESPRTGG
ncbi:MAG TPA: hypothetical protein VFD84_17525 [Candidatus Binatia bacterium]|jgi:hypothetical protein|nr:hypothetical protein [Candidatus Binatia bacterium]